MKRNVPRKSSEMINWLEEQINSGQISTGGPLPSLRTLMGQFSLSMGSVKNGIDYLASMGLVERAHGRGVYVKEKSSVNRKNGALRISVLLPRSETIPGISPTVFMGIQECAEKADCSLLVNYLAVKVISENKIMEISEDSQGIILVGTYDNLLKKISLRIPAVGICMHEPENACVSIVDIDPFLSAKQASEYFKKKKCAEVIAVTDDSPAYINRVEIFSSHWRKNGGECETVYAPNEVEFHDGAGYLFATGSLLQDYSLKYFNRTGKILSEKNTVLGIDGKNRIDPTFHKAPTIMTDWRNIGKCAFKECIDRINAPGTMPKRMYLPGRLCE